MTLPLSVAIVCKNNEATIGRTLDSVRGLAREIVAIDSGSTDRTIELLQNAGARVEPSAWLGHVRTKQLALERCTSEWVLCLDSDESLEPTLRASIERALGEAATSTNIAGFRVNRKVFYRGRFLAHAWQPEWRLRLVRRGLARWGGIDPHDKLELIDANAESAAPASPPRVRDLAGDLRHDSITSFADFLGKQVVYGRIMAEGMARQGQRGSLWRLVVSPTGAFLKQLVLKRAFLDGWRGWLAAMSTGVAAAAKHTALYELTRTEQESQTGTPASAVETGPKPSQ